MDFSTSTQIVISKTTSKKPRKFHGSAQERASDPFSELERSRLYLIKTSHSLFPKEVLLVYFGFKPRNIRNPLEPLRTMVQRRPPGYPTPTEELAEQHRYDKRMARTFLCLLLALCCLLLAVLIILVTRV